MSEGRTTGAIGFLRARPLLRRWVYGVQRARCAEMLGRVGEDLGEGPFLDLGAGTCNTTELLRERGLEVTPVDVADLSFIEGITPVLYDGRVLPFDDDAFETALILTVLHHAREPDRVLAEARRVARRVIVIEDVVRGRLHTSATKAWDSLMNLEFAGHPHSNRSDAAWRRAFEAAGLRLVERHARWSALIMWQVTYVLERA
jgi:SAM-dependent methyltransferase